jgi:hypothetical protein
MDLTKITTPFGLLDEATQNALRDAYKSGKIIEAYDCGGWDSPSDPDAFPVWHCQTAYRVRPDANAVTMFGHVPKQPNVWAFHMSDKPHGSDTHRLIFEVIDDEPANPRFERIK